MEFVHDDLVDCFYRSVLQVLFGYCHFYINFLVGRINVRSRGYNFLIYCQEVYILNSLLDG